MQDGDETAPQRPESGAAEEPAAVLEAEGAAIRAVPGDHPVADSYVACRLARERVARDEAERRSIEDGSDLAGEEPQDSATGFYLLLGVIVAALLLAVLWVSGSQKEIPERAIRPRFWAAPTPRFAPMAPRSLVPPPSPQGLGQPASGGNSAPESPGTLTRTRPAPGSPAPSGAPPSLPSALPSRRMVPGASPDRAKEHSFARWPAPVSAPTGVMPGGGLYAPPLVTPGAPGPPAAESTRATPAPGLTGPGAAGASATPGLVPPARRAAPPGPGSLAGAGARRFSRPRPYPSSAGRFPPGD